MSKGQITGMRGVFLVAAELSRRGLVVSTTSRSARGADLLATDQDCRMAFSVQVKTDSRGHFFLVGKHAAGIQSDSHIFVLVGLKEDIAEYYVIPSKQLSPLVKTSTAKTGSQWWFLNRKDIQDFRDNWDCFTL